MGNTAERDSKALKRAERRVAAGKRRMEGATWQAIAEEFGYASPTNARRDLLKHMEELPRVTLEELRTQLDADLRKGLERAWPLTNSKDPNIKLRAVDVVGRQIQRRADLAGIKAPLVAISVTPPETRADLSMLTGAELDALRALQAIVAGARPSREVLAAIAREWVTEVATPIPLLEPFEGRAVDGSVHAELVGDTPSDRSFKRGAVDASQLFEEP